MKLAMAQMAMSTDMAENLKNSLRFCEEAKGSDLLFFPEIQLCPFFPQYEKKNVDAYCLRPDAEEIRALSTAAGEGGYYMSPNVYLEMNGRRYDTSLWIDPHGELLDCAKMVHIAQAEQFYEQDYYTPSDDGFKVFNTPFGRVGEHPHLHAHGRAARDNPDGEHQGRAYGNVRVGDTGAGDAEPGVHRNVQPRGQRGRYELCRGVDRCASERRRDMQGRRQGAARLLRDRPCRERRMAREEAVYPDAASRVLSVTGGRCDAGT